MDGSSIPPSMDDGGIPGSITFAANDDASSVGLTADDDAESIVFSTGVSAVSEATNDEQQKVDKKTTFRFSVAKDLGKKNQQSLLDDLETQRKNSYMDRMQLRRQHNIGAIGQAGQDTTTPTKKTNYSKKRPGIKEENLAEINKAALQEVDEAARARKKQEKKEKRREDVTAAARARKAEAATALDIDVRDEAARVLAEVEKFEEERIAKEKMTQQFAKEKVTQEEELSAASGQS